jgi:signal transduction histidine kinase
MAGTLACGAPRVVGRRDDSRPSNGRFGVILEDEKRSSSGRTMRPSGRGTVLRAMIARLRAMDPFRADLLLAAAFLVEALVELVVLVPDGAEHDLEAALLIVATAGMLAIRRRSPVAAALVAVPLFAAYNALGTDYLDHTISPFFGALVAFYGVGRHLDGRIVWVLAAYAAAGIALSAVIDPYEDSPGDYLITVGVLVFGPGLAGRVLRNRAVLNRALREKAERLAAERAERAGIAALEERTRIAGELHDVVAHALSAMVVQASGARRLAERDPARASEAFRAVETSGREALTEIRRLLGVLRREDEELALAPQPSLRHVGSLVQRVQAAGLPVELAIEGDARELPIGIDLTAYRVVQEALGGALEHGHAGLARVKLSYGADHVELEVADDGGAPSRPLLGIRERVTLSGGTLRAGARRDGGHVVRARLPLGGPA